MERKLTLEQWINVRRKDKQRTRRAYHNHQPQSKDKEVENEIVKLNLKIRKEEELGGGYSLALIHFIFFFHYPDLPFSLPKSILMYVN